MDKGPIHLVEAGLIDQLTELGWKVKFDGHHQFESINAASDPPIGKLKNPRLVSRVCESVAKVVGEHVKAGELPVTLGGDHSLVRMLRASEAHGLTSCAGYGHDLRHFEHPSGCLRRLDRRPCRH